MVRKSKEEVQLLVLVKKEDDEYDDVETNNEGNTSLHNQSNHSKDNEGNFCSKENKMDDHNEHEVHVKKDDVCYDAETDDEGADTNQMIVEV